MKPCVCGHMHPATCPHCGCSYYEPDNGDGKDYSDDYMWDRPTFGSNAYHYQASRNQDRTQ